MRIYQIKLYKPTPLEEYKLNKKLGTKKWRHYRDRTLCITATVDANEDLTQMYSLLGSRRKVRVTQRNECYTVSFAIPIKTCIYKYCMFRPTCEEVKKTFTEYSWLTYKTTERIDTCLCLRKRAKNALINWKNGSMEDAYKILLKKRCIKTPQITDYG